MANEAKNLEDLKNVLYKSFNKMADRLDRYSDFETFKQTQALLSEITDKIITVEQQIAMNELIRKAGEAGRDIEIDLDKRSIRSTNSIAPTKVKTLG